MMPTNGWPALGVAATGLVMAAQIGWRATLGAGNNAFGGSPSQAPPNTAQNAPGPCNMRTSDARTLTFAELRSLLVDDILGEEDPKPLLIRHALSTWPLMHWLADAESLANGTAAEASMSVRIGDSALMSALNPEAGLARTWGPHRPFAHSEALNIANADGAVEAGEAVRLARSGALAEGAYVFFNVSGSALARRAVELRSLWAGVLADLDQIVGEREVAEGASRRAGEQTTADGVVGRRIAVDGVIRLAVGSTGSGLAFHRHGLTMNLVTSGAKHWFIFGGIDEPGGLDDGAQLAERRLLRRATTRDGAPMPMRQFAREVGDATDLAALWGEMAARGAAWECTQRAGDLLVVPSHMYHGVQNLGATVALAITHPDRA